MADAHADELKILVRHHGDGSVERLELSRLDELHRILAQPGAMACVRITKPSPELIDTLQREFGLHPLAVEDLRKRHQRPKIDAYADQYMVVAYEAIDGSAGARRRRGAGMSEVHLFLGANWMLTVHWEPAPLLESAHDRWEAHPGRVGDTPGEFLYTLLDAIVDSYFPELDRLSDRIDSLEDRVLGSSEARPSDLREILAIKRHLLDLRRVLAPTREVANVLLRRETPLVEARVVPYFQDLYDHLVRVLDQLDVYRDLLAAVLDARLTVASNSLNVVVKRLTAFTVILMVPTLIAGIYGMNFDVMPELHWPLGYPLALALMLGAMAAAVVIFRRQGWF